MGVPIANHSSYDFERSLHRAFYAIHRSPISSDIRGSPIHFREYSLKRDHRGKPIQTKNNQKLSSHSSKLRSADELPPPPFLRDTSPQQSRESLQGRPVRIFQCRRRSVTFDPSTKPPVPSKNDAQQQHFEEQQRINGFRSDYSIGDKLRSPYHMGARSSDIDSLRQHDFAFVKRSDGSYTYAILVYRSSKPIRGTDDVEEIMVFALSNDGTIKSIRKRYWNKCIRLVSNEGL